jgi:multidrug efflux pump
MTLSDISVRRPVLAAVMSLLVIVFGLAALQRLPIRELPNVDSAVVTVTTTYTGAAPEVIDTDITEVIDSAVAGISGVKTITSQSRRGRSQTTIEFELGRNIDEAANDIRDAVGRVRSKLPREIDEPQIVKSDSDADPVMRLAVTSSRMSASEITDFVERYVKDRLTTLDGVSSIEMYGARRAAIRIWLDRRAIAARNLTVADIEEALRRNNVELPAGEIESRTRQFTVRIDSRMSTVEQFSNMVVRSSGDYPIRLADLARVSKGVEDDTTIVRNNGQEAVGIAIARQAQANTIAISAAVRAELERMKPNLPDGMSIKVGSDDAIFIGASIREVVIALMLSLVLVVLVILLFLRSFRATLIPAITIPVSLLGCMFPIFLLGFSVNVLTLLALLLAIGLVVDDAIVMLENIERRIALGESPLQASVFGSRQVTFAIIATSVTLIAVFVPISFLGGAAGRLFSEFGFVMASAVVISTFVALTACPALASKILKARSSSGSTAQSSHASDDGSKSQDGYIGRLYRKTISQAIDAPLIVIAAALVFSMGAVLVYLNLPRQLTPSEDRGVLFIPVTAPQGSTIEYTDAEVRKLERRIAELPRELGINTIFSYTGSRNRPYRSFVVMRLEPWEDRTSTHSDVIRRLRPITASITGARGFPVSPSGLGLRGNSTPLRVVVGGPDFTEVKRWAQALLERAEQIEGLRNPELDYEENQTQINLAIDRRKADDLGIGVATIAATLQTYLASREVTTYLDRGREYPVILRAGDADRQTPRDVSNIFLRAADNRTLVPLGALVDVKEGTAAPELRRYNRMPAITLSAALDPDYPLGTAINEIRKAAAEVLPPEATIAFAGQSQQYLETSGGVAVTFALAILIVFLVLAAQFESFIHPLIIMLSVPLALAGAVYSLALAGQSLNIYSQIGIILLIGLMAKNGILIVEFANQLRDEGYAVREAVIEASVLRLRPIVMTIVSTVLGAVPLVLASGAGAESRAAIGIVVIGGLSFAAVLTLYLTPVLYDLMARATAPRGAIERQLATELEGRTG